MEGTALWKLKGRVYPRVNTRPLGVIGAGSWTDELQPNADYVWP